MSDTRVNFWVLLSCCVGEFVLILKLKYIPIAAEQGDAVVDCWYYGLNACAKKGINASMIFDEVHRANMDKRDPESGVFMRREDGKIIKPLGWKEPDLVSVMNNMMIYFG